MVSVFFNLLWATIHHDVMRMEPYFRMSKPDGATAADSILLEYSYMFPLYVPYRAAKKRHYVILLSSFMFLFINLVVTPLISGLFTAAVVGADTVSEVDRFQLNPGSDPYTDISTDFSYRVYNHLLMKAPLPQFTSSDYALLGLDMSRESNTYGQVWKFDTTLLEAEMVCDTAEIRSIWYPEVGRIGFDIIDQRKNTTVTIQDQDYLDRNRLALAFQDPHDSTYIRHNFTNPWTSIAYNLNSSYLYLWASAVDPSWESGENLPRLPRNVSAIFCSGSYITQPVAASVAMPWGNISHLERKSSPTTPTDLHAFAEILNGDRHIPPRSAFGNLIPDLVPSIDSFLRLRFGSIDSPNYTRQNSTGNTTASSNVVFMEDTMILSAFALYNETTSTLETLLDPLILARLYERVFKLLFAVALSDGSLGWAQGFEKTRVTRSIEEAGYVVNRQWARGAQGGLVLVALMAVAMCMAIRRRHCALDGEPNSIAAVLRVLAASPDIAAEVDNAEFHGPKDLLTTLKRRQRVYKLVLKPGKGPKVKVSGDGTGSPGFSPVDTDIPGVRSEPSLWQLQKSSGVALVCLLLLVAALLLVGSEYSKRRHGLTPFASPGSVQFKILYSYIPITIGMAIEPVLESIGSLYCMLGPYAALRSRHARRLRASSAVSSEQTVRQNDACISPRYRLFDVYRGFHDRSLKALTIDYDKSPPLFQFLQSLHGRDISLTALTVAIALANILAVLFSALFVVERQTAYIDRPMSIPSLLALKDEFREPALDMYYIMAGMRMAYEYPLSWTTGEFYILPFDPAVSIDGIVGYNGNTLGIGTKLSCDLVPASNLTLACERSDGAVTTECPAADPALTGRNYLHVDDQCWMKSPTTGNQSIEYTEAYIWHNTSSSAFLHSVDCPDTFFVTWMEQVPDADVYPLYFDIVMLKCNTGDMVAELNISVFHGQSFRPLETYPHELTKSEIADMYSSDLANRTTLSTSFINAVASGVDKLHQQSVADNFTQRQDMLWFDYLIGTIDPTIFPDANSTSILPARDLIQEFFAIVYKQLFAINLRLHADEIVATKQRNEAPGTVYVFHERVVVQRRVAEAAAGMLLYIILIVAALYWGQGQQMLAHMPTCLAGTYALLYASNAKEECGKVSGRNSRERAKMLWLWDERYAYGPFDGEDGKKHVGVYREEKPPTSIQICNTKE